MKICKTSMKKLEYAKRRYWEKQNLTRRQLENLTQGERIELYKRRKNP